MQSSVLLCPKHSALSLVTQSLLNLISCYFKMQCLFVSTSLETTSFTSTYKSMSCVTRSHGIMTNSLHQNKSNILKSFFMKSIWEIISSPALLSTSMARFSSGTSLTSFSSTELYVSIALIDCPSH